MPNASHAQFAYHRRPSASTTCGVGTPENGFAIGTLVVGSSTIACTSCSRRQPAITSSRRRARRSATSSALGARRARRRGRTSGSAARCRVPPFRHSPANSGSPLLGEGLDALAEVGRLPQEPVCQTFELEPDVERAVVGRVQHALRHRERERRVGGELLDKRRDGVVELGAGTTCRRDRARTPRPPARAGRASRCPSRGRDRPSARGAASRPSPGSSRSSPRGGRAARRRQRCGSRTRARARGRRRRT